MVDRSPLRENIGAHKKLQWPSSSIVNAELQIIGILSLLKVRPIF
jgi:hypothetical protein